MKKPDPDEMPTTVDVLRYGNDDPRYMTVPGDDGTKVVGAHAREAAGRRRRRLIVATVIAGIAGALGTYLRGQFVAFFAAAGVLVFAALLERLRSDGVPEVVGRNVHAEEAVEEYDVEGYVADVFVDQDGGQSRS